MDNGKQSTVWLFISRYSSHLAHTLALVLVFTRLETVLCLTHSH
jgi:hypothetical protein